MASIRSSRVSRRDMLKAAGAAAVAGGATALGGAVAEAQQRAPAVLTNTQAGRRFRADGPKHHWPGTGGGTNDRRDSSRYIRLAETGQINVKALVGGTYPLSRTSAAYEIIADRDVVATVVLPNA